MVCFFSCEKLRWKHSMVSMEYPKVIRSLPLPALCSKIPKVQPLFTWSQRAVTTLAVTSSLRQWDRGRVKKDMLLPVKDISQRSDTAPLLTPIVQNGITWAHWAAKDLKIHSLFPVAKGPAKHQCLVTKEVGEKRYFRQLAVSSSFTPHVTW